MYQGSGIPHGTHAYASMAIRRAFIPRVRHPNGTHAYASIARRRVFVPRVRHSTWHTCIRVNGEEQSLCTKGQASHMAHMHTRQWRGAESFYQGSGIPHGTHAYASMAIRRAFIPRVRHPKWHTCIRVNSEEESLCTKGQAFHMAHMHTRQWRGAESLYQGSGIPHGTHAYAVNGEEESLCTKGRESHMAHMHMRQWRG